MDKMRLLQQLDWNLIVDDSKKSDIVKFIENNLNWDDISRKQKLSEDFIRTFQDKVNWNMISISQTLTEDFIEKFEDKVDWHAIK